MNKLLALILIFVIAWALVGADYAQKWGWPGKIEILTPASVAESYYNKSYINSSLYNKTVSDGRYLQNETYFNASVAKNITSGNTSNWTTAYNRTNQTNSTAYNHTACWKPDGSGLGFCSDNSTINGTCTCQ